MTIRKPRLSKSRAAAVCSWAVALGANTSKRLAKEWRITPEQARQRLSYACAAGEIQRCGYGKYASLYLAAS